MAKLCELERQKRREKLIEKYRSKRNEYRAIIRDPNRTMEEKQAAQKAMQRLPRDSNRTRSRNRCAITGRPRGVYRRFKLGRNKLREFVMSGMIPGIHKASW